MPSSRILVVDDDSQITRVLRTTLTAQRYDVRVANDGETALEIIKDWSPDLVLTDVSMPNMDGLALCHELRTRSQVPIIVISVKEDDRTKVKALDLGADDYVTKPFSITELLARVRANLRRAPATEITDRIDVGDFSIDLAGHSVSVCGRELHLTPKEFELLAYLARHPGKVVQHRTLISAVWGADHAEQSEYLRVFVGQLRKKLEADVDKRYIVTERWIGYRFIPEGEAAAE
jgi:two-component system KDP operon response regulator KdpE